MPRPPGQPSHPYPSMGQGVWLVAKLLAAYSRRHGTTRIHHGPNLATKAWVPQAATNSKASKKREWGMRLMKRLLIAPCREHPGKLRAHLCPLTVARSASGDGLPEAHQARYGANSSAALVMRRLVGR
jgi:hypothetical protein